MWAAFALVLWLVSNAIYRLTNRGLARNARMLQLRRYLMASLIVSVVPCVMQTSLTHPVVWLSLLVSLTWQTAYPLTYHLTNRRSSPDYDNHMDGAFGIYLFGWLTGLALSIPHATVVVAILEFLLLLLPLSLWVYYFACQGCIDVQGMKMLQETNHNEIIELFHYYHPLKVIGVAVAVLALGALCLWGNLLEPVGSEAGLVQHVVVWALTLFFTIYLWKLHHGLFVRTGLMMLYDTVRTYAENNRRYVSELEQRLAGLNVRPLAQATERPSTIILVIGESASRDYMSAVCPQDVDTTPWMRSMATDDAAHFLLFPHAYSCNVQTVPTLEKALTEYNQYDGGEFFSSCSIIDVAHKLGWRVHWYSNQGHLGAADTPITLVADTSEVAKWTKQELNKVQYDESLLDFLGEVSPDHCNLLVVHLKGSHFNFENRFPPSFRKWGTQGDDDNITNYKNSIRYTDSLLERLFDYGREHLNLQAMVYFSDHACTPDKHRCPNFGGYNDVRIPLFTWLSDEYQSLHPARTAALRAHRESPWTNDLAYELLCGIMDVESNHFNEKNSLASMDYRHTWDTLVTMDGRIRIADDPAHRGGSADEPQLNFHKLPKN